MPSAGASSFSSGSSRGGTGAPERTGDGAFGVRRPGQDEKEIGEPIEIDGRAGVRVGNCEDGALRPSADGPREEEPSRALVPARENEALEGWQRRIRFVDLVLEPADRLVGDPQPIVASRERNGEVRSEVEELVLDAVEAAGPADQRVELVDVAHSRHARVELRDTRAVAEARLPLVPAARVDARQAHRLVALAHAP